MRNPLFLLLVFVLTPVSACSAEEWGTYAIVPVSAPTMVLEAVQGGTTEGTIVSINTPAGKERRTGPHQRWTMVPREGGQVVLKPTHDSSLALSVAESSDKQGAQMILEKETGKPAQLWSLVKRDNGSYTIAPKHAPRLGMDLFGGKQNPGSRVDLWDLQPKDPHLQWRIQPLAGSGVTQMIASTPSTYIPRTIKPEEIRPGTIKEFTFSQSKIFPGTVRHVTVFIPAQYDSRKAACVYVKTDGYNPAEKAWLESMIASGEIPVMVGVFVKPGSLPPPRSGTSDRRNRCFEYDAVDSNQVRFLHEELLPTIARDYQLNLSSAGNDRCISGGSSGGIAAFTAAWNQPEMFSRVYAASGSWVAFRGGHEFPTMVRKFEARPVRAFLTTATHDMENVAGDWFLLDQEMDKALKFSGYEYQFRIIVGGHVQGYAEHWQEAMAYLWKDWPRRLKAGPSAPRAQEILIPGEEWLLAGEGYKNPTSAASNATGDVFFIDASHNQICRIGIDGTIKVFCEDAGQANGLTVAADGTVFTVSEKSGQILRHDSGGKSTCVMEGIPGHSILARPDGSFYVTTNDAGGETPGRVWLIKDGKKKLVDSGLKYATGMTYRPDQWLLSVAEGHSKWVHSYQIAADGTLINKERFFPLHVADWDDDAGAAGVCSSVEGRQLIATRTGIQISADDGPTQIILTVPGRTRVTGVALGGKDRDTLYAFGDNKIWKRKIRHHAMGAWSPWNKVSPNSL